ncbi:MAG TPA: aminotransferase class I/II-fold pyridoxal phosphate-dependent enzyme [Candidatus Avacidaminococcus intestinavium]|uniref:Aminotransferase class I/II-fold pyridoxal phosphate-dependent enzyme n=1 Tax=Candidatus Avacidaminococcus intestinavium TaxID=2840684 RepID=A0A9D1MPR8_9FIRM|nr:aminotransferase class I/II-fold pyridoxal phosphate-dependent enzyme [Candidatus Avacidaminococcus intestinavium]
MITSIVAPHAKGKAAQDKIFGANSAAVAAAAKLGADKVTNATIGAILDEDEKLICLPTVESVYRGLPTTELIAYAPIAGLPTFQEKVLEAAFGSSKPDGYIAAVATAGGSGVIHHAVWNYMSEGDTALTSDWYWGPYNVICKEMHRKLDTYKMLDENNQYNLPALQKKVKEILAHQDSLLLIINTPAHNPTGYSLSDEDMDGVIKILRDVTTDTNKTVTLLLDVAYLDYAGEKEEVRKFFRKISNLPSNILTIVAYSMSKGFTMYGQRTGAMIGVSASKEIIQEFKDVNQYSSRATWSNINRPCMATLAKIYTDQELLAKVEAEREHYYQMIKARADLFTKEAKACGLKILPYVAGFFISIPSNNPDAVCDRLHEDNIFAVPLAAGVRIAVCAVPLKKISGMAEKINKAMQTIEE